LSVFYGANELIAKQKTADYLDSGIWSKKAIDEAARYCQVNIVASSKDKNYTYAPSQEELKLNQDAAYFHFTSNETIGGVEMFSVPQTAGVPVVCDMSSHILSRPVDVSQYGVIYAGAQKISAQQDSQSLSSVRI